MRETTHADYGFEYTIIEHGDMKVKCPSYPSDVDYIRVVLLKDGREFELIYWRADELNRIETLGAIMLLIGRVFRGYSGEILEEISLR